MKIISWIFLVLLIVVSGFFLLSNKWVFIGWEIFAAILVSVGCVGELWMFHHPAKNESDSTHRQKELRFIASVAIGVTMELIALTHTIPEAIRLEQNVVDTRLLAENLATTNAQLVSSNLQFAFHVELLRSNNFELAKQSELSQSNIALLYVKNLQTSNTARLLAEQTSNSFIYTLRFMNGGRLMLSPEKQ